MRNAAGLKFTTTRELFAISNVAKLVLLLSNYSRADSFVLFKPVRNICSLGTLFVRLTLESTVRLRQKQLYLKHNIRTETLMLTVN